MVAGSRRHPVVRKFSHAAVAETTTEPLRVYGFRLNKNVRGQPSPELNSQNERLWNGCLWRKAAAHICPLLRGWSGHATPTGGGRFLPGASQDYRHE
jgi:hypothetical protein